MNTRSTLKSYPNVSESNFPKMKRSADASPQKAKNKRIALTNITNNKKIAAIISKANKSKLVRPVTNSISSVENQLSSKKSIKVEKLPILSAPPEIISIKEESEDELEESLSDNDVFLMDCLPDGVEDYDKKSMEDVFSVPNHAKQVFQYYFEREKTYTVEKYLSKQKEVTRAMRSVLVDWMVEVQESFELNHETLYLAVKLVDMYLMRNLISKGKLQLLGATAVLIACKYDERVPPLVDDFLYICDDTYTRYDLLSMERSILLTVDYNLGIPLSYRFLRRFARCAGTDMETLTLARFILETALMNYELIDVKDSKIAAAALLLAIKMKNLGDWSMTLRHYSRYEAEDLTDLVKALNKEISAAPAKNLLTIRTKYSHSVFFQVARIPPLKM